jgi:hemolysin activation/secretion protein
MKNLFISICILCVSTNIALASAYAGYDAGVLNNQYSRDLRTHEAVTRSKDRSAIITTKTTPKTEEKVTSSDIKSVVFINNVSIPSSTLLSLIEDKINQPMTNENVSAIRKTVMKYYQEKGYFSAIAVVNSQDFQTGELVIEVREGGRNSITIQE